MSFERAPRLRVAILGAGMIGGIHRRAALLAGADVVGVLSSTPERSRTAAAAWDVATGYASFEEVLADDVDVVHVATPNASHAPYALAALDAGRHVVCEKPLGIDLPQARAMAAAAAAGDRVATVPFVYRYHPLVREIRARREAGELGDLHLLHGSYLQDWLLSPQASNWRVDPAAGGASRAFADIGSHWCDLVEWVAGERFTSLCAQTSVAVAQRPTASVTSFGGPAGGALGPVATEDAAALVLRTASGALGSLLVSQISAGRKNRLWFELDGSAGSAVFDQENPETVWMGDVDGARVLVRGSGSGSSEERRLSSLPAGHAQGYAQCFEAFVADTYTAVRIAEAGSGQPWPPGLPTFADGLRAAQLTDAVLRSAGTAHGAASGWVDTEDTDEHGGDAR